MDLERENDFYKAAWQYGTRSCSYYALAGLASKKGDKEETIRLLELSLETNAKNPLSIYMLGLLKDDSKVEEKVNEIDPLFFNGNDIKRTLIIVRNYLILEC